MGETMAGCPRIYFSRWVSLAAGVYLMILSGSIYMFAVYSSDLKQIFGYSTEEINLVGTLGNVGTWAGVLGGLWLDYFGPRSSCLFGGLMNFAGYFLLYLAAKDYFPTNAIGIGIFAAIMGQGGSWVYNAALKVNTQNFRAEDRFYAPDVLGFLLFLAIMLGSASIGIGMLVNTVPTPFAPEVFTTPAQNAEVGLMSRVKFVYAIGIALAVFNGASSIVTGTTDVSPLPFAVVMLALLATFLLVPVYTGPLFSIQRPAARLSLASDPDAARHADGSINAALVSNGDGDNDVGDDEKSAQPQAEVDQNSDLEDFTLIQTLLQVDFWLLFFIFFAIIGAGITLVNNFAELVFSIVDVDQSIVYHREDVPGFKTINTLVSLFSSFNTLGRMLVGFLSDWVTARWGKTARVSFLVLASALMGLVQLYFAFAVYVPMLYPGVIFLGLAYGATFCIVPTLALEFFGFKYFASNYGIMGLAPAVGSEVLATLLAGKLNDYFRKDGEFVTTDSAGNKTSHCNNSHCYRYTFFITAFVCAVSVVVSLWVWKRRRDAERRKHAHDQYLAPTTDGEDAFPVKIVESW
ncbi:transporter, major facilitator subfamily protein [Acanthamoeba castellanii str. Neff]|uniref:Transporter, major facilitator subfamily protein n=1 Tax=Acanthamoeba castellanii (strain ATCC 30010 / Neff) TaxID=1257118 RepID=L8H9K8_ACACF|nr:transporter, major facilitator subfamily protein [Acanthamoeba castellanii str. Neff]ELR21937.1 transporter, major facilitator subfamily protein [Acanthamoeba castellanii str. Neff]